MILQNMDPNIKLILSKIKGKEHLERIFYKQNIINLLKKNYSLLDIYDLTETTISENNKKTRDMIENLKLKVDNHPEYFENYYKYIINTPEVCRVLNPNKSIVYHLIKCLSEISNILKDKSLLPVSFFNKTEFNSFLPLSNYINNYFGLNNNAALTLKEIGSKYEKSSELIRINLFENRNRPSLCELFLNGIQGYGLEINKILLNFVNDTLNKQMYSSNFLDSFSENKEVNIEIVEKLIEIFKLELIEITFEDTINNYYTIVKKEEAGLYRAHFIILDSIFREGDSFNRTTLIDELEIIIENLNSTTINKSIKKNGLNIQILNVLLNDYFKIEIIKEDEDISYQFQWQYLSSVNAKVTRILLENGNNMTKNEILNEYNVRAIDSNMEIISSVNDLKIRKTNKIKPIGKLGRWIYSENDAIQDTIEKFIDKSIIEEFNGKITFAQLKEFISNSVYSLYPESNLRTNIFLCCRRAVDNENLFIHQDFLEIYPEIKTIEKRNRYFGNAIINTIVKIIQGSDNNKIEKSKLEIETIEILKNDGYIINRSNNYYAYLTKFLELGIILKDTFNNTIYYSIDEEELKNHDLEKLGKKSEPEYKKNIRSYAINILKERKKIKLSELKDDIESLMPKDISYSIFYRIFQDRDIFIKEQIGSEIWISLETSLLPIPQDFHIEVQEESTELLGNSILTERVHYDIQKLKSEIINELFLEFNTYKMSEEILSDSFDIFYSALLDKGGNSSKWGNSLLQSLYELLCTKTDYYDRETCLNKLITGYETYLKCFIKNLENKIFTGQADVISNFHSISDLRTYKDIDRYKRTDIQKTNFSYILSRIKYLSDVSRHDKTHESLDMGLNKQIKNAIDFIALYLFSGYLIKIQ